MMKPKIVLLLGLLFTAQNTYATKLNEQIQQNVDEARKSYEQLVNQEPPRLWIHVRTEQQRQLLQHIADWLKPVSSIKIEPIQLVKEGPKKSQLRFFSSQDKDEAGNLLKKLQKIFPHLELQDFSAQYGAMGWLESGHFELWLAPDLKKITLPEPSVSPVLPADIVPPTNP